MQTLGGKVPGTGSQWSEAVSFTLEFRLDRLWMVLEPTIWVSRAEDLEEKFACGEFVRERKARRYNAQADKLLNAWIDALLPEGNDGVIEAYGRMPGVGARFKISRRTAFSRRNV